MALDGEAEAALELSIVAVDVVVSSQKIKRVKKRELNPHSPFTVPSVSHHRRASSWWKPEHSYYAIAWLDPVAKQSTGAINANPSKKEKLYFPLHPEALGLTGTLFVTIQVFFRSRLMPFHETNKFVGIAALPLSAVGMCAETVALGLRRPSGEEVGTLRVTARVLWDLGFRPKENAQDPAFCHEAVDAFSDRLPSAPPIDPLLLDVYDVESSVMDGHDVTEPSSVNGNYVAQWISTATPPPISYTESCKSSSVGSEGPENVSLEYKDSPAVEGADKDSCAAEGANNEAASGAGHDLGRTVMGLLGAFAAFAVVVACRRFRARRFSL